MACSSAAWRATRSLIRSTSARDSSSSSRERDSSTQASQQVPATATISPASTSPTAGANHAVEQDGDQRRQGARDQRHGHPHLRLDDVGEVVDDSR